MIVKDLKNIRFEISDNNELMIQPNSPADDAVFLSWREMFSLARFIIRVSQKGRIKKKKGEARGQDNLFNRPKGGISGKR